MNWTPSSYLHRYLLTLALVTTLFANGPVASAQQQSPCAPQAAPAATQGDAATPEPGVWTSLPEMPRPRSELGAVTIDGTIFVIGGFGGGAMLDCFDAASGTWNIGADLPEGVHHPGVATLDGIVYVAGGYMENDHGATDAVWAYDPATDAWEARAPLPEARGALGLAVLDGRMYAVGGATDHLGGPVAAGVHMYDPATDTWEARAPLPTPREHLAVAAGEGRIFAVGGRANGDESDQFASAVEAYDPATDTWAALPPLPTPRGGFGGVFVDGHLVVLGGERGTTTFDTVEAYDPATQMWTELPPMPTARHGVGVTAVGDTLYAVAGSTQAGVAENTGTNQSLHISPDML